MQEKEFYLTKQGLEEIKKEYAILKEIRAAKTKGETPRILESEDINPEYLSFREDLNLLEMRLSEIENIVKNARIIKKPSKRNQKVVGLGSNVCVELDGEDDKFMIVGTLEADPSKNKISDQSPIGRALLGKKEGELVTIRIPQKTSFTNYSCKIKKIKYN